MIKPFMMFKQKTPINYSRFKKSPKSIQCFLPLVNTFTISTKEDFNPQELEKYLKQHSHQDIVIKTSKTTIEDVFMDLTNLNQ
jgi:hypothetical protein